MDGVMSVGGVGAALPFNGQGYVLDGADFTFIDAVRGRLSAGSYRELFTVDNHLRLIDGLRKRLSVISAAEARSGLMNWGLRARLSELDELVGQLRELRQKLFMAL